MTLEEKLRIKLGETLISLSMDPWREKEIMKAVNAVLSDKPDLPATPAPAPPTKQCICSEAHDLVHGPRQEDYDHPCKDFWRTARLWTVILGKPVSTEQVALCMIAVKISREINKHKHDNLVDIIGYTETLNMVHNAKLFPGN